MKQIKLLILTLLIALTLPMSVNAATFKNGDRLEILSATMPEDGTKITFTIEKGTYPKKAKIVIYGEKNVYCPVPGLPSEPKTPDKNPFTLLSEYNLSENDIKALAAADTTFITTMKFDVECGDIYAKVLGENDAVKPSDTQTNRPSGGDGSTTDSSGNKLVNMLPGTVLETNFVLSNAVLTYHAPQGSYMLADWLVVFDKNKVAIAKTLITTEVMESLAAGTYEARSIVEGIDSVEGLSVIVSDTDYEIGAKGELPVGGDELIDKDTNSGLSPLMMGLIVFLGISGLGLGYNFYLSKKKSKQ